MRETGEDIEVQEDVGVLSADVMVRGLSTVETQLISSLPFQLSKTQPGTADLHRFWCIRHGSRIGGTEVSVAFLKQGIKADGLVFE